MLSDSLLMGAAVRQIPKHGYLLEISAFYAYKIMQFSGAYARDLVTKQASTRLGMDFFLDREIALNMAWEKDPSNPYGSFKDHMGLGFTGQFGRYNLNLAIKGFSVTKATVTAQVLPDIKVSGNTMCIWNPFSCLFGLSVEILSGSL
jgi:hypothetical protein